MLNIFYIISLCIILIILFFTISILLRKINTEHFNSNVSYSDNLTDDILEEEEHNIYPIAPLPEIVKDEQIILNNNNKNETKYIIPDINKLLLSNPTPLNINISYNAQNSVNEIDNIKSGEKESIKNNVKKKDEVCSKGRIFNNSDWIYGENAWTNNPDFYIPDKIKHSNPLKKISQPLNEVLNKKSNNNVCPMMINTPWSEYKSGDSEPEPYNL
jgi:hypothetical protein